MLETNNMGFFNILKSCEKDKELFVMVIEGGFTVDFQGLKIIIIEMASARPSNNHGIQFLVFFSLANHNSLACNPKYICKI